MSELLKAAKAVIERWDNYSTIMDGQVIYDLRAAVERDEKPPAEFREWWWSNDFGNYGIHHAQLAWTAAQQAERERIRARAKIAAEKTWKAEDRYIFPQHYTIEKFVDALLEDGDE